MKRIDKIINMIANRNEYTINMNKSATPVPKFRKCSQIHKVNSNNIKIPRSGDGQIEVSTMFKLWAFQLDENEMSIAEPSVASLGSTESEPNLFRPKTILKTGGKNNELVLNNEPTLNLACQESMPDSENNNSFYEDSDNSVCDKDYVLPISSPSSDESIEITKSTNIFPSFSSIYSHKQALHMLKEQKND